MAIVDKGIKISVPTSVVPDDFVAPAVEEFSDHEYKRSYTLDIAKATVENADRATTFGNIINDAAIGIIKQILDLVTADFIGTNAVDYYSDFTVLDSNSSRNTQSDYLTNNAFNYVCKVDVYIKTN